ncbi:MAG: hypothetical protein WCI01_02655 [Chlorobiaceae bacterium]
MKKHDENIEREVSKTMTLLDEMKPLELHHQFRVRLMQRVERECTKGIKSGLRGRVDFRLAFMGVLLVVNVGSAFLSVTSDGRQATATISELLDNQSYDYTSQDFAYYDQAAMLPPVTGTETKQTP